jgi:hypothetical protein
MLSCSGVLHKTLWICSTYMRKSALSHSEHTFRLKRRACSEEHSANQTPSLYSTYEGGPKNNRNLNVARELEVVARCAARSHESRQ